MDMRIDVVRRSFCVLVSVYYCVGIKDIEISVEISGNLGDQ